MLSLRQLYTDGTNNDNNDDDNDDNNDTSDDDNDTQWTNHDCIGSLACMPNEPKTKQPILHRYLQIQLVPLHKV